MVSDIETILVFQAALQRDNVQPTDGGNLSEMPSMTD